MSKAFKNLVAVLATPISTTEAYRKANTPSIAEKTLSLPLKRMLSIYYLMQFKKNQAKVQDLLNLCNEVNAMILAYAASLD